MRVRIWLGANLTGLLIAAILISFGLLLWSLSPNPGVQPPLPGEIAFAPLVPLRQMMIAQAANSPAIIVGVMASGLALIWVLALRSRRIDQAVSASIVIGCGLLALQAQVFVMREQPDTGMAIYLFAGAAFCLWMLALRKHHDPPLSVSRRAERILLSLVLAVTIFGRVYDLKRLPYGVDGDESKWTVEVVSTMVDGSDKLGAEYHRRYLPMSFVMEAPFHWIMGVGLTPARLEVAVFSILATFFFYRLARELFDVPTALVATLLLAVSLADLSASRAANVESHTKLWSILPFYGLAVALRTRASRHFLLAGLAVAGAMLTYETLMPIAAAALTFAIGAALRERREWRAWLRRLAALATAPLAVAVVASDYLFGRMQYYQAFRSQAEVHSPGDQLLRGVQGVLQMFSAKPNVDWLYFREGPIVNGLLVPLLFLGIIYAVVHLRRRGSALSLTWLAWVFIPIPIFLHTPLPRVLYPGLPALYLLIAMAMMAIYRVVAGAIPWPRAIAALGIVGLSGFAILNLTVWFQEVTDPYFELRRREAVEIVAANVEPDATLLMPYILPGETVETERDFMELMVRERRGAQPAGAFEVLRYHELLPRLAQSSADAREVKVLVDNTEGELASERQQILDAFRRCYSAARVNTTYFDLYSVAGADIGEPACRSAHMHVAAPPATVEGGPATPIAIAWSLDTASATQSELACWQSRSDTVWVEAESFDERVGWIDDVRFVTGFSGNGYLADDPGSEYAATTITIPRAATYRLWIRSYRRQLDNFPAYIEMSDQVLPFGETRPGVFLGWQWQSLAELSLQAGPLPIRLTRPFDLNEEPFIALFVDTLVLSPDPGFDPGRDPRWQPVLQLPGPDGEHSGGTFELHLQPGQYRCEVTAIDGDRLIDDSGAVGITSSPVIFEVTP